MVMNLAKRITRGGSYTSLRIRRILNFWIHIREPKFILSIIANGYCLPFQCTPVCISLNNNKSVLKFKDFVEEAFEELLLTNRVVEKLNRPYVVHSAFLSRLMARKCGP